MANGRDCRKPSKRSRRRKNLITPQEWMRLGVWVLLEVVRWFNDLSN
jgi:hypothetical protein